GRAVRLGIPPMAAPMKADGLHALLTASSRPTGRRPGKGRGTLGASRSRPPVRSDRTPSVRFHVPASEQATSDAAFRLDPLHLPKRQPPELVKRDADFTAASVCAAEPGKRAKKPERDLHEHEGEQSELKRCHYFVPVSQLEEERCNR